MEEDTTGRRRDNVFYDSFKATVELYQDVKMEIWEEAATISLIETDAQTGLFDKSDIIIVYDKHTFMPMIVTERIYMKNYNKREWFRMKKHLRQKLKIIKQELGFNIRVSYSKDYMDYVHYKEEWWQWALKQARE